MAKLRDKIKYAEVVNSATQVIREESSAVLGLASHFRNEKYCITFYNAIKLLKECRGKVVVTGIGKSAIIAQKIVATFNSTGTYSIFLHSSDSLHGDLGMVQKDDVVLIISKSGDSNELKNLLPVLRSLNVPVIAITGNINSALAKNADIVLNASVEKEACPHDLAPTSSTTAALVLGDAIAVTLLKEKGFTKEDFASRHPGGMLGKKLLLKVSDLLSDESFPRVNEDSGFKDVIYTISSGRLGCAAVLKNKKLSGIITDGDIRRLLEKNISNISEVKAKDIMNRNPKTVKPDMLAGAALELMEKNKITQLIIADKKEILGIIHLHKLLEEGL